MRRSPFFALLGLLLVAPACGGDDTNSPIPDGGADVSDTGGDGTGGGDTGSGGDDTGSGGDDTDDTTADATGEDANAGSGTIRGNIFYNGAPVSGTLHIGGFVEYPSDDPPIVSTEAVDPLFSYAFEFEVAVDNPLIIVAIMDVDSDSDDPFVAGEGDLFGRTQDAAGVTMDGEITENINVEIR